MRERVTAWAPASVSNLGPGFDALGAALSSWGDEVSVHLTPDSSDRTVGFDETGVWQGTTALQKNTAGVAAEEVATIAGYEGGFSISIKKGIHAGSGVGSSAASAVAGALAMSEALQAGLEKQDLIPAVMKGESIVSGAWHGDNVLPSLLGGFILMRSDVPSDFVRIAAPPGMKSIIVLPQVEVFTKKARDVLPESVSLREAVDHAARLAMLIDALHRGDVPRFGSLAMSDGIVEPRRAALLEAYAPLKEAALSSGADGCGLSGSGPALFAVSNSEETSRTIQKAFETVCEEQGLRCRTAIETVDDVGARILNND